MSTSSAAPAGFLTFTLHAHLPYVVNHGTWPHGMEWLHEAAAETYLPLLRMLARLERDGIRLACNLSLSPILLEQLAHPVFQAEFPRYLTRKIVAAREDEAFFAQTGEDKSGQTGFAETARFWQRFYTEAAEHFQALGGDLIGAFRGLWERGQLELLTSGATHGYMPLLGTDASLRAQIRTAVDTHTRHLGRAPAGIWIPECGYRPAGPWQFPTAGPDGNPLPPSAPRIGVEQALAESGLRFFFVDTHLVEASHRPASPYETSRNHPHPPNAKPASGQAPAPARSLYHPYLVEGPYTGTPGLEPIAIFPRDPRTGLQVWSSDAGYPGDGNYLDFHKKRWPGGHRYWRVTGPHVSMEDKQPYHPADAQARIQEHARHFVHLVREALATEPAGGPPPILCSPFDAELFGHWWFEGILWLEAVARQLHAGEGPSAVQLITGTDYLQRFPASASLALEEGSWGAEGTHQVWLNPETAWTYTHLYPAELALRAICSGTAWYQTPNGPPTGKEIVTQMCRELLLMESSDWQFLITTGAARDYAELRFLTHKDLFAELHTLWDSWQATTTLTPQQTARLQEIQLRDGVFPNLDPHLWSDTPTPEPSLSTNP